MPRTVSFDPHPDALDYFTSLALPRNPLRVPSNSYLCPPKCPYFRAGSQKIATVTFGGSGTRVLDFCSDPGVLSSSSTSRQDYSRILIITSIINSNSVSIIIITSLLILVTSLLYYLPPPCPSADCCVLDLNIKDMTSEHRGD